MHQPPRQNDSALIIGSGIGGLSMAIILARLGYRVTVLEKNRQPGGMLRSYVRRGVSCNVGVHYLGAMERGQVLWRLLDHLGIAEDLPLIPMGVDGPVDRYVFNTDGNPPRQFDLPAGLEAYAASLKEAFPGEQGPIEGFMALLRQSAQALDRLDFLFGDSATTDLIDQTVPLWDVLGRLGCSPGLKSVLSVPSIWFGVPPSQCPQFYHTMTLASYLSSAWRLEGSGSRMTELLVQRLENLGGRIICGQAVQSIDVQSGQVTGLTLDNGQAHKAPLVIGAVHPQVVVNLLDPAKVKPSYRRRIAGLTNTGGMFAVNAVVPDHVHQPLPYNLFSMDAHADGTIGEVIYAQLRPSTRPESLLLSLITRGYDELWQPWSATVSGRRGGGYEAEKLALANELIERIAPVTGPLDGLEVIDTYTPLTIRDWVNSPDGSAYGVMKSDRQMLSAAMLNRTSIKGLYLAGQSVMAPGILGTILGSLATAKFIVGAKRFGKEIQL